MNNLSFILCILLLLSGCQDVQDKKYNVQEATARQLKEHFSKPIPIAAEVVRYTENGRYFLIASSYDQVRIYESDNEVPIVSQPLPISIELSRGAGFIDSGTVYYSGSRYFEKEIYHNLNVLDFQSGKSQQYEFKGSYGNRVILANADYLAYGEEVINWRTGERYAVRTAHALTPRNYSLTASGKILSSNYYSDEILLHDPLTDTSLWWDSGLSSFRSATTRSERFVIAQASDGACRVWPVPTLKPVKSCGRGGWSNADYANIATHPTDDSFAVSAGGRVEVYRLGENGHQRVFSRTLANEVSSLAFSTNHRVAIGDKTGHIEVWDTERGSLLGQVDLQLELGGDLMTFAPSGNQLLYGRGSDLKVHLFDIPE